MRVATPQYRLNVKPHELLVELAMQLCSTPVSTYREHAVVPGSLTLILLFGQHFYMQSLTVGGRKSVLYSGSPDV